MKKALQMKIKIKETIVAVLLTMISFDVISEDDSKALCDKYAEEIYVNKSKSTINNIRKHCKALAESGDAKAQYNYASIFFFDNSTDSQIKHKKWMLLSANNGYAKAQYFMAGRYLRGSPDQVIQAVKWYENASRKGISPAPSILGDAYHKGIGVPVDGKKAVYWYKFAVEKYDNYGAMLGLVDIYTHGIKGVAANKAKAKYWQLKADE